MRNVPKLRFKEFSGEWEEKRLGECVEYKKGYAFKADDYNDKGVRIIRVSDLGENSIKKENPIYISKEKAELYKEWELYPNDIIATTVGSRPPLYSSMVGKIVIVTEEFEKALLNQNSVLLRSTKNFSQKYIYNYFFRKKYINHIENIARGNANQANITLNDFFEYSIAFPSLEEQEKIADFLSSVDKKISITEEKLDLFKEYKKGIMQKIFKKELRFKDSNNNDYPEWEEKKLGELLEEYNEKTTTNNQYPILSSTAGGIYLQSEYFNKQTASENNIGYKIIPKGYFTYRSMSDTGNFTFNIQERINFGIVSPAYPVFSTKLEKCNKKFLFFYLNNSDFIKEQILVLKEGGTRYALSYSKFIKLFSKLPCLEEQQKIADFLSTIDTKIEKISDELENLKEFKKGLLQQMFV